MQLKDIVVLKKKLSEECNNRINGIIDQMIANEDMMKVTKSDTSVMLKGATLELKMILTVEDNVGGSSFQIGSYNSAIPVK